jgi:hypothetical protein
MLRISTRPADWLDRSTRRTEIQSARDYRSFKKINNRLAPAVRLGCHMKPRCRDAGQYRTTAKNRVVLDANASAVPDAPKQTLRGDEQVSSGTSESCRATRKREEHIGTRPVVSDAVCRRRATMTSGSHLDPRTTATTHVQSTGDSGDNIRGLLAPRSDDASGG